ncbi:MAG: molecular chaperone GrpE [Streptosporangiaceae bacterium]|jgi:molecular chaperone GrpE|nr:GrpE protein [Streptosporangiaceae bacterium]MDX6430743.1 molecular chaperone GrpE [Streptosporangiaceae bacterium]
MSEQRGPVNGPKEGTADLPSEPPRNEEEGVEESARQEDAAVPELLQRIAELDDQWRRAVADADNQRKRFARDLQQSLERERERVSAEWLAVVDNLERALEHADADPKVILNGVRAVRDQAVDVLARLGFPRREDVGQRFDPARHSAVATRDDVDAPPGTVVEVLQPGYGDSEHQLRPALVVVAQKAD